MEIRPCLWKLHFPFFRQQFQKYKANRKGPKYLW